MMDSDVQHTNEEPRKMPFVLLKEITGDFSSECIIDHGRSGTLYKGMHKNGQEVVVKVFYTTQGPDSFQHELVNLTRLKHQNIVKLIGFCCETEEMASERTGTRDITVKEHKALCFEHVHNGSLHKYLSDEQQGLNWHLRFKIIKGICEGLKFLHEGLEIPICHFDLNLNNILLDRDMVPKIDSFTLSRPFGEEKTPKTSSTLGTRGYLPPEYLMKQVISKEFDIFSLGVIIAKIMVGHMGTAYEIWPRELIEDVHTNWREKLQVMPGSAIVQMKLCLQIAVKCLEKDRCKRPSIGEIIQQLNECEMIESIQRSMQIGEKDSCGAVGRDSTDDVEPVKMSHKLLSRITNDFSEDRVLGDGAFGVVYKGVHLNGEEIAVKVLRNISAIIDRDFRNEFMNLAKLKHLNIVGLVGYCHESENVVAVYDGKQIIAEKQHMALCLEYVDNGSLRKHISDENEGLNWHMRYKIIKGICDGLKYLREGLEVPIWHLDLKPDNILLDRNMIPKIADFGLSRLLGDEKTRKTISAVGTLGYLPPEYVESQVISSEFDIFSLGVIITKIMIGPTGYSNIVDMKPQKFIKQVHDNWKKKLQENLRPRSLEVYCQQVKTCIELAVRCLRQNRHERPTIQEIVRDLNEADDMIGDPELWIEQLYYGESIISSKGSITLGPSAGTYSGVGRQNNTTNLLAHATPLPKELSFKFLEQITNGFSRIRKICQGSFGTFYKGVLPSGELVAVKMFDETPGLGEKQFRDLVRSIMLLTHKNIIKLTGYCAEVHKEVQVLQYNGKYVLVEAHKNLLCFEYLSNGRLDEYISAESCGHDWNVRLKIIKGLCQGLQFLHNESSTPITHQRLTANNIWLDENMVPKISEVITPMILVSGNIEGYKNIYQAPEDQLGIEISSKSNVYSLGILIIQLAAGEKYENFVNRGHSKNENKLWKTSLIKSVYPSLDEGYINQVKRCIEVGERCIRGDPNRRPPLIAVVHMLEGIVPSSLHKLGAIPTELLKVYPAQLHIPFKPNKSISCPLQLINTTDDHVAVMLLTKSQKRYMTKMPLCGVIPPQSTCTLIVTTREEKKQPLANSNEFLTLVSTVVHEGDLSIKNADLDSEVIEFSNFFKDAKETAADKVHSLILKVVSDPPEEATSCRTMVTTFDITEKTVNWAEFIEQDKLLVDGDDEDSISGWDIQPEVTDLEGLDSRAPYFVHPTDPFVLSSDKDGMLTHSDGKENCEWAGAFDNIWTASGLEPEVDCEWAASGLEQEQFNPIGIESSAAAYMDDTIKPLRSEIDIIAKKNFLHVLSVDVHATEPWILTTHYGGDVAIWDYRTQAAVKSFDCITQEPVYSAKFIEREQWLVAGDGDGTIYVFSYDRQQEVTNLSEAHDGRITSLAVHSTDSHLLSSSDDHVIKLWNWENGWECTRTFKEHDDAVTQVDFNLMDGTSFASASLDHTIKMWDISSSDSKITLSGHLNGLLCVHNYTSNLRQHLIAGSWDGTARIWDLETKSCVQTLRGHANRLSTAYRHPELPILITGSHDGTVRLWNSTTYRLENIIGVNLGAIYSFGYIKGLRRIVVGCHQGIAIMEINFPRIPCCTQKEDVGGRRPRNELRHNSSQGERNRSPKVQEAPSVQRDPVARKTKRLRDFLFFCI